MRFGLADGEGRAGWLWDIWDLVPRDMERLSLSAVLPMARLTMLLRDSGETGAGGDLGPCAWGSLGGLWGGTATGIAGGSSAMDGGRSYEADDGDNA